MSSFVTKIPVDVDAVKALLPFGSDIEGVVWNGKEIELRWGNQHLRTPFTFHVDYSLAMLGEGQKPSCVIEGKQTAAPALVAPTLKARRRKG